MPKRNNPNRAAARNTVQQPCFIPLLLRKNDYNLCPRNVRRPFLGTFHCCFRSERTALGGIDGDGAQKILQRLLVGGAADVQLL